MLMLPKIPVSNLIATTCVKWKKYFLSLKNDHVPHSDFLKSWWIVRKSLFTVTPEQTDTSGFRKYPCNCSSCCRRNNYWKLHNFLVEYHVTEFVLLLRNLLFRFAVNTDDFNTTHFSFFISIHFSVFSLLFLQRYSSSFPL